MAKTLGGFLFTRNCIKWDYCFKEAIVSLFGVCDEVAVVDVASTDGTAEALDSMCEYRSGMRVLHLPEEEWSRFSSYDRIAYFQNVAAGLLTTDYQLLCQADEVVHEKSYPAILEAIESGYEGFMLHRTHLWGDPNHRLAVEGDRMPGSTSVIRLTKRGYQCVYDGENIDCSPLNFDYEKRVELIHYGFVRKREVMKGKIINMQEHIYGWNHDTKLDGSDIFDPTLWFNGDDLAPFEDHPSIMRPWVDERK